MGLMVKKNHNHNNDRSKVSGLYRGYKEVIKAKGKIVIVE